MKKAILIIAVAVLPFIGLQAQVLVGGTVSFDKSSSENTTDQSGTSTTVDGPTYSSFEVSPFAGVFISENFLVGLGLGYSSDVSKQKDVPIGDFGATLDEYKVTSTMMSIMPMCRYYYMPTQKAGLFLEGSVGLGFGKDKEESTMGSTTTTQESDVSGFSVNIIPGIVIYVTDYLALEANFGGLQYASYKTTQDMDDVSTEMKGSAFSFAFNPGFFEFGVTCKLGE